MLLSAIKQHSKYEVLNISPSPLVLTKKTSHDAAMWLDAEFKLKPDAFLALSGEKYLSLETKD